MNVILASNSPRRTEILNLANIKHLVVPSNYVEKIDFTKSCHQIVKSLAYGKAKDVAKRYPNDIVIGADTIVVCDECLFGKPKDQIDAIKMLQKLSGKTHKVMTGVSIIFPTKKTTFVSYTYVTFNNISLDEIKTYLNEENVYDKAGSYAIQGAFCKYISKINGDYYNVMGLPIAKIYQKLKEYENEIQQTII